MASSSSSSSLSIFSFFVIVVCSFGMVSGQLTTNFYSSSCPTALSTIRSAVSRAVGSEPRMGASLLRLHFHDCFVNGCDASVLLDDTTGFTGEKTARQNANSLRGFNVIDNIKTEVERICPGIVSCADILAVAARDSVAALDGPKWDVRLGRRDARTASLSAANSDIPAPTLSLSGLLSSFSNKGFNAKELVALSGGHTIGQARCTTFRSRIYNDTNINPLFATFLKLSCPTAGQDNSLAPLDSTSSTAFNNGYFRDLTDRRGLLHSDQELFNGGSTDSLVTTYSTNAPAFSADFANAMIKMGNLSPLTGANGEIRVNCRKTIN